MIMRRVSRHLAAAAALGLALALLAACGDDSDGDGDGGDIGGDDAPGATCEIDGVCPAGSTLCFAAGEPSSCQRGGLCVGDPSGVACAEPCNSDADCAKQGPASVCLLDCEEPLLNGYCTTPDQSAELLDFPFCTTPAEPRRGIAGSS